MSSWRRDTPEVRRLMAGERAALEATELVCDLLDERGVSRRELADRLGVGRSEVSQRLSGKRNLSVKSLGMMLHALGYRLHFHPEDLARPASFTIHGSNPQLPTTPIKYTATGAAMYAVPSAGRVA